MQRAFGRDRHSVSVLLRHGNSLGTELPLFDAFDLGGFQNLSGFSDRQLLVNRMTFGRVVYSYQLGSAGALARGLYLGGSLEGADVRERINGPGSSNGLVAGSLFVAATMAGAAAAGRDGADWRALGDFIGEAFQVADDIKDVLAKDGDIGKPVGRDAALGRPNVVNSFGVAAAVERLEDLLAHAQDSIPACPGRDALRKLVREEASSFVPKKLLRAAA